MGCRARREREKEARSRAIVDEARKLFIKDGFDNTSVERVASALDLAKGTVYLYFPNKEALFFAALGAHGQKTICNLRRAASRGRSAAGSLKSYARAHARVREKDRNFFRLLHYAFHKIKKKDGSDEPIKDYLKREFEIVRGIIEKGVEAGEFHVSDAGAAAEVVHAAFRGQLRHMKFSDADDSLEKKVLRSVDVLLDGLRGAGGRR